MAENNQSVCKPNQNSEKIMLLVKSILRYLEFKAHKDILFKFFLCQFFSADVCVIPLTK